MSTQMELWCMAFLIDRYLFRHQITQQTTINQPKLCYASENVRDIAISRKVCIPSLTISPFLVMKQWWRWSGCQAQPPELDEIFCKWIKRRNESTIETFWNSHRSLRIHWPFCNSYWSLFSIVPADFYHSCWTGRSSLIRAWITTPWYVFDTLWES